MLIDWFTVGAQVINFVVLVWLLKRFLYKPVLDAIDARERQIAAKIADAAASKAQALAANDALTKKNEAFDQQREAMLARARQQAEVEAARLVDAARQAADDLSSKRRQELRSEADQLSQTLADRAQHEIFELARRTLADLASSPLEEHIAEVFVRRLRALDGQALADLRQALQSAGAPVLVRSAFELPAAQQTRIREALAEVAGERPAAALPLRFELAPQLVGGVELIAAGQKLAWNIDAHLKSLQLAVDQLLSAGDPRATSNALAADAEAAVQG